MIGIQKPGVGLTKITGDFSVSQYNSILREMVDKIDRAVYLEQQLKLHPDGHHLSRESHFQLASAVTSALQDLGFSKIKGPDKM